jgi:signal transduction histidine kinase
MALCQLFFQLDGIWIHESQPLVGSLIAYYLAVPYRLIREYKKRWELQRKNQLLTQVEELKTNFLSLVTHDLKTPVARIQGLAEVLLRQGYERLLERDRETLRHITQSTEELNRFISSILELNRVESQRLPLKIESKDINQLIERSAEEFEQNAKAKQIRIRLELEPLFPIRIDAGLISKVMNNLIDNAIKYSLPGTCLTVESREANSWIEIAVRDQGVGMTAEEKDRLFTRFFRAKNEKTASSGGTGLGLYLSKYFIEAHGGRVEVESTPNEGSTFRIFLPIEGVKTGTVAAPPRGLVQKQAVAKEREYAESSSR